MAEKCVYMENKTIAYFIFDDQNYINFVFMCLQHHATFIYFLSVLVIFKNVFSNLVRTNKNDLTSQSTGRPSRDWNGCQYKT